MARLTPTRYQPPGGPSRLRLSPRLALISLAAAGMAALIAFLVLATSVSIITDPQVAEAKISVSGWPVLRLGHRHLLLAGRHRVRVQAPGYAPAEALITVARGDEGPYSIALEPLHGYLQISLAAAGPPPQGRAFLDGADAGAVPGTIKAATGHRLLRIETDLYAPMETAVEVTGRGQTQSLELQLAANWGTLNLRSEPPGAQAWWGERSLGTTPLSAKVRAGRHPLRLALAGRKTQTLMTGLDAGQSLDAPPVILPPLDATLELDTVPSQALVSLNGRYAGSSPLRLSVATDAPQSLRVSKPGHAERSLNLALEPGSTQSRTLRLEPLSAQLDLEVSPADAMVLIDGREHGRGSTILRLLQRPYLLQVRRAGYVEHKASITPGVLRRLRVQLLTPEQHFWAAQPAAYQNPGGLRMLLFRDLGDVDMGSPRREAGRRSNEQQYKVRLTRPFYVSATEVSNAQFRRFRPEHSGGHHKGRSLDGERQPAVNISWQDAALYCNWLSAREGLEPFYTITAGLVSGANPDATGYRLPSEAEWTWLALGADGARRLYPWGNAPTPPAVADNFADDGQAADITNFTLPDYDDGHKVSAPVASYAADSHQLHDLGGNAAEWIHDWYSPTPPEAADDAAVQDPLGPDIGEFHAIRGASWMRGHLPQLRLSYRRSGASPEPDVGFRIARYVRPQNPTP